MKFSEFCSQIRPSISELEHQIDTLALSCVYIKHDERRKPAGKLLAFIEGYLSLYEEYKNKEVKSDE